MLGSIRFRWLLKHLRTVTLSLTSNTLFDAQFMQEFMWRVLYTPPRVECPHPYTLSQTVLTTPLFRDVYGVDPADLGYVWVAGPLSGLAALHGICLAE